MHVTARKSPNRTARDLKRGESRQRPGAQAKYRQILDSARALFLEQGFDTTSVDAISRHAGVSKATLYAHYDDKDDLLLALIEDECRRSGPKVLWRPSDAPIDLKKGLRAIAKTYLEAFLDNQGLAVHRLIMSCASRYPGVAEVFMKAGPDRCDAEMAAFLRAARAQGLLNIPDIKLAATQFLSLIQGKLILKWSLSLRAPSEAEYRALVEGGIRVFLAAYRSDKGNPKSAGKSVRRRSAKA